MATLAELSHSRKTDWTKCCLCQQDKKEDLKSPPKTYTSQHDGYSMLAENIPQWQALMTMPIQLDPKRLDESGGIEETLRTNEAKYHQSCRLLFNNTKLERASKRKLSMNENDLDSQKKFPRTDSQKTTACFLCDKEEPISGLRQAMTMPLDERLNECAKTLGDERLIAKLSSGDIVAQDGKYHATCLVALYNKERCHLQLKKQEQTHQTALTEAYAQAFSELVTYVTETKRLSASPVVFKLADLNKLYKQRLEQLGVELVGVNSTRLKDRLMDQIHELEAIQKGRDIILAYRQDVGSVLSDACQYSEALILAKAAKILRNHILDSKCQFQGTIGIGCLESIPPKLLQFVGMIEHGADIKSQLANDACKTDLVMAQLLQYNCHSRYKEGSVTQRHSKDRETPFPIYIGMSVYAKTRKRHLVEMLHENGISISYDRVLEISAELGEAVVNQYVEDGVVCPPILRKGLFTSSAMDNIDHNPSSTTCQTSFHGTSISLFQHPSSESQGDIRETIKVRPGKIKSVPELPESFTNVPPAHFREKNPHPPVAPTPDLPVTQHSILKPLLSSEYEWLQKVHLTDEVDNAVNVTWSAHHASQKRCLDFEVTISSLLPMLREKAHSVATIKHVMDKIRETVTFLNPGQVPVIAADQPIYAVAKQIQWHWPDTHGEDKFVLMFGGLHIEMVALKSIGTFLQGSGWTGALAEAEVASPGTAESFLSASAVTKTRQAHQVTACALHSLINLAYADHCTEEAETPSFDVWCESRKAESPQFHYWYIVLAMELTILLLVRAFREANFKLYCDALAEILPYLFANNNTNYARWLPIHLRDMLQLDQHHPQLAREFHSGHFVVHKSNREFSSMAIDQAHEQANAVVKGDGGAIGLTEDERALRRWMVAGPEVSKLVADYEAASAGKDELERGSHHDQNKQSQKKFLDRVGKLTAVMQDMGNPFQEESNDLLTLDTKDIADPNKAEMVSTYYERGTIQFREFLKGLEENDDCSFYKPIKKNKIDFFKKEAVSRDPHQKALKEDCQLFSQLFISCQSRECNLQEFFCHENQSVPASLSDNGKLYTTQKSQLVEILESKVSVQAKQPEAETLIIDGSALVHTVRPQSPKTFLEYATQDVLPIVTRYADQFKRTDIVFDMYLPSSLKAGTRSKRGLGIRRRVTDTSKTPKNWNSFLRDENNKTELFHLLADKLVSLQTNLIVVTQGENAVSNSAIDLAGIAPCPQEEADTRIFVHAKDMAKHGSKVIVIRANDTDVVIIAIATLPTLQQLGLQRLWVTFGQGSHLRWIPIHEITTSIGPEKTAAILFFHAFSGCDVVSGFRGKGKKSAWDAWNVFDKATDVFTKLSQHPPSVSDEDLQILEKYVVTMYDRSSPATGVDEARLDLFAQKQRSYESIPPTKAALLQHTKRAAFQAGGIWSQSVVRQPKVLSSAEWGWVERSQSWEVCWTTLPPIAKSCQQLTKCGCKKQCSSGRCKCHKFGLTCTALCSCEC